VIFTKTYKSLHPNLDSYDLKTQVEISAMERPQMMKMMRSGGISSSSLLFPLKVHNSLFTIMLAKNEHLWQFFYCSVIGNLAKVIQSIIFNTSGKGDYSASDCRKIHSELLASVNQLYTSLRNSPLARVSEAKQAQKPNRSVYHGRCTPV